MYTHITDTHIYIYIYTYTHVYVCGFACFPDWESHEAEPLYRRALKYDEAKHCIAGDYFPGFINQKSRLQKAPPRCADHFSTASNENGRNYVEL